MDLSIVRLAFCFPFDSIFIRYMTYVYFQTLSYIEFLLKAYTLLIILKISLKKDICYPSIRHIFIQLHLKKKRVNMHIFENYTFGEVFIKKYPLIL